MSRRFHSDSGRLRLTQPEPEAIYDMIRRIVLTLLIIVLILGIPYYACNGERRPMDAAARVAAPGKFATLSGGLTHYQDSADHDQGRPVGAADTGETVILVHGFSMPMFMWEDLYKQLVNAGYRVVRYDLYGRGYSDRPDVEYNPQLFQTQLHDLRRHLGLGRVHLAGISMGGAIVTHYAAQDLKRPAQERIVQSLTLMAPFSYPLELPLTARLLEVPYVGHYVMTVLGDRSLKGRLAANVAHPEDHRDILALYQDQMQFFGFKRALRSTTLHMIGHDVIPYYEAVGQSDLPVLLIWGEEDQVVPFAMSEKLRRVLPNAEFQALEDTGHLPPVERPRACARWMREFLRGE